MSGILNAIGLGGNKDSTTNSSTSSMSSSTSSSRPVGHTTTTTTTSAPATSYQTGTGYENTSGGAGYQNTSGSAYQTDRTRMAGGTDDAMTRSEEQLHVGKETVEAGKAKLHKYVTSEHVSKDVPLAKESVTLEREPITDANRDKAMSGPDIKEAEYEVNLREERPVVSKETVAKERVRLAKNVEQTTENVGGDIRKEHIEYGATPGVDINKAGATRTSTSNTTGNDLNLQGVKATNPTYTA